MSTFHPAASSVANFNDTISTISTTPQATLLLFLASKLACKCDVHRPHSQTNTELFSSHGVCPVFGFFSPAKYTTHLQSCTRCYQRGITVLGVYWSIFACNICFCSFLVCTTLILFPFLNKPFSVSSFAALLHTALFL